MFFVTVQAIQVHLLTTKFWETVNDELSTTAHYLPSEQRQLFFVEQRKNKDYIRLHNCDIIAAESAAVSVRKRDVPKEMLS